MSQMQIEKDYRPVATSRIRSNQDVTARHAGPIGKQPWRSVDDAFRQIRSDSVTGAMCLVHFIPLEFDYVQLYDNCITVSTSRDRL